VTSLASDAAQGHFKDAILDDLAARTNVAQFVSFGPGKDVKARYVRLRQLPNNPEQLQALDLIALLLEQSGERSVNIRSYDPAQPKAHEFLYGLSSAQQVLAEVHRLALTGLFTIVNETIDVADGGVSGVAYGDVIEFAPEDTPRCVERPGTASFPRDLGIKVLEVVYGFRPALDHSANNRIEFSLHPLRRGVRREHTVIWEQERGQLGEVTADVSWPNRFSRFVGDKAFGLLIADATGLPVPRTTVVSRKISPFSFGSSTGTGEPWLRTCPVEPIPGKFTTLRGWTDPFALLMEEDPDGVFLASVLRQEGVDSRYSGATLPQESGAVLIEGVAGTGEEFMQGEAAPMELPPSVTDDVRALAQCATDALGPVRFEWAHDGNQPWIVQLHRSAVARGGQTIYPGEAAVEHRFDVDQGLEALRRLAARLKDSDAAVVLVGRVGITSHFGDILRAARIPSRLEDPTTAESPNLGDATAR
jgi:hypothetical protein